MTTTSDAIPPLAAPPCSAMCHFKDADSKTIREIMRWSVMECPNPELTQEIQSLGTKLKLAISRQPNAKDERHSAAK